VAGISVVVGCVGIMNMVLVSVTERTRKIGLRMAVGARRHHILRQFFVEAVVLCLVGGAIGIAPESGTAVPVWPGKPAGEHAVVRAAYGNLLFVLGSLSAQNENGFRTR